MEEFLFTFLIQDTADSGFAPRRWQQWIMGEARAAHFMFCSEHDARVVPVLGSLNHAMSPHCGRTLVPCKALTRKLRCYVAGSPQSLRLQNRL